MPADSVSFRGRCGLFHHVFVVFMGKRAKVAAESTGWQAFKARRAYVNCALVTVVIVHMSIILLMAGDLESNPGPDFSSTRGMEELLREQEGRTQGFVERTLHMFGSSLSHMVHSALGAVMHEVQTVRQAHVLLEKNFHAAMNETRQLQWTLEQLEVKLESVTGVFEDRIERLETEVRRNNLKFFNVPESSNDDFASCTETLIELLTAAVPSIDWKPCDFLRAFRIGQYRDNQRSPRPLLVQFERGSDKMAVLTGGREVLKKMGITVAADLTEKQKAVIESHRQRGLSAYFKGSKLVVAGPLRQQGGQQQRAGRQRNGGGYQAGHQQGGSRSGGGSHYAASTQQGPHNAMCSGHAAWQHYDRGGKLMGTPDGWYGELQQSQGSSGQQTRSFHGSPFFPPLSERYVNKPHAANLANLQAVAVDGKVGVGESGGGVLTTSNGVSSQRGVNAGGENEGVSVMAGADRQGGRGNMCNASGGVIQPPQQQDRVHEMIPAVVGQEEGGKGDVGGDQSSHLTNGDVRTERNGMNELNVSDPNQTLEQEPLSSGACRPDGPQTAAQCETDRVEVPNQREARNPTQQAHPDTENRQRRSRSQSVSGTKARQLTLVQSGMTPNRR